METYPIGIFLYDSKNRCLEADLVDVHKDYETPGSGFRIQGKEKNVRFYHLGNYTAIDGVMSGTVLQYVYKSSFDELKKDIWVYFNTIQYATYNGNRHFVKSSAAAVGAQNP